MAVIRKKVWPAYFGKIISGEKKFELRLADFAVNENDILVLEEWDNNKKEYTGRKTRVVAKYIFKTKNQVFWPEKEVKKYGFQVIQFEPKTKYPRGVEIVSSAIIQKNRKILIAKSPKWSNKWTFPGGHIEAGESVLNAAMREATEKTGLKLKPIKILAFGELINSKDFHRPAHFIYFDCVFDAIGGKIKLQNNELSEIKWLKPKDALKLELAESYSETLQKYIEFLSG